jgi:hypothetical protein
MSAHAHARRVRAPSLAIDELIAALRRDGCRPREAAPGVWVASCPLCKLRGRPHAIVVLVGDETEVER